MTHKSSTMTTDFGFGSTNNF